jgi:hypothetical protein
MPDTIFLGRRGSPRRDLRGAHVPFSYHWACLYDFLICTSMHLEYKIDTSRLTEGFGELIHMAPHRPVWSVAESAHLKYTSEKSRRRGGYGREGTF